MIKRIYISVLLLAVLAAAVAIPEQQYLPFASAQSSNAPASTLSALLNQSTSGLDAGQNIKLTANAFGGVPPYTYEFFIYNYSTNSIVGANAITSQNLSASFTWDSNSTGPTGKLYANVIITDNSSQKAYSNTVNFTVNPKLAFNFISLGSNSIAAGHVQTVTANINGGTPPYTYNFTISNSISTVANTINADISSTSNSFSFVQNATWGIGIFTVNVTAEDSAGNILGPKAITYNATPTSTTTISTSTSTTSTSTTPSTTSASTSIASTSTINPPNAEVVFTENGIPSSSGLYWSVSYNGTIAYKHASANLTFRPACSYPCETGNATFFVKPVISASSNTIYLSSPSRGFAFAGNITQINFKELPYVRQTGGALAFGVNGSSKIFFNSTFLNSINISMTQSENAVVTISNETSDPNSAPPPSKVYRFIIIKENQPIDKNVSSVVYTFSVPESWILSNASTSAGNIRLFKYYSGSWETLKTTMVRSNSTYYTYSAVSNSLSTYAVGFVTGSAIGAASSSATTSLKLASGYPTYFWAGGYENSLGNGGNLGSTNWTEDSNFTEAATGGKPADRYASQSWIGHSTAATGTITSAATAGINETVAGIGANVIYSDGVVFRSNSSATSDTLSFTVSTTDSFVVIGISAGGGVFSSTPTTTATNCTVEQDVSMAPGASSAVIVCNNPEPTGTYSATASITASADAGASALALAAYVFPEYKVTLDDSPTTGGNIIAGGVLYTSGETANLIGTGTLNASANNGYSFQGWSASNSNVTFANSLASNTLLTVEGSSVVTATYGVAKPTLSIQHNPVQYGVTDAITATAPSNTEAVEIIINGSVVATGTGTATYTVCSTAACLAGGEYNVTAEDTSVGPASSTSQILQVVASPSSILYYIPISFNNSQTTATPAPFQQNLTFNSLSYESYESGNLSNIEFFYANGTIIPSWLERGNFTNGTLIDNYTQVSKLNQSVNTIYWLNLSKGIPAKTTLTVYMGFAEHGVNLFSNTITGEAPELTPTYAQYDDGGKVFINYWNFNGTKLPPGWKSLIPLDGAVTVDDGVTLQANTSSDGSTIYYEGMTSTNMVVDYDFAKGSGSFASGWTSGNPTGPEIISGTSNDALYSGYTGFAAGGQTGGIYLMQSGSETSVASPMAIHRPDVYSFYWVDGLEHFWRNYGSEISSTNAALAPAATDTLYAGGDWYYTTSAAYENVFYQWIRTRAYPPNGVMPKVSVGSIQQVEGPPSLVISPNPITYGNFSTITLTGRPSSDSVELLINGKVVAGPSTGTITYTFNSVAPGYGAGSYTVNAIDENNLLSTVQTLTVNPATPQLSLSTPYPSLLYNGSGGRISFDVNSINNQVTATLSLNGTSVATTNSINTYLTPSSIGTYSAEVSSAATANYTAGVPLYSKFSIFAANVLYKVPITISNTQTIPTLKPFQYMLTANSLQYAPYEASNLDNILFTYANGTVVPSWLESNDTTTSQASVYWLNILGGIPASSNVIVYMDFVSNAINMFNRTRGTGEAPQLSPLYGEYDSGFKVFTFYDDFEGNTLNTSIWSNTTTGLIVDNGLNTTTSGSIYSLKSFNFTNNYNFQVLGAIHEASTTKEEDIALVEPSGGGPYVVASNRNASDTADGYFIYTFINGAYTDGSGITSPYANTQYMFQINMSASDSTATIFNTKGPAVLYSSIYGTSSVGEGTSTVGAIRAVQIRQGYYDVYWARVVTRPPNGVAPTATFGSVEGVAQFNEAGLPNSGELWSVTYNSATKNAIVPNPIKFYEPIGSYSFKVPSVTIGTLTYAPTPSSGTLVTGNATNITFSSGTCSISLTPSAINFGILSPSTDIATTNSVVDTNSGSSEAYMYVYGGNWIGPSSRFGVSNTTWSVSSGAAFPANRLSAVAHNTTILVPASSSNSIYFGLGIPGGAPSGSYTQNIIIENSC